MNEQQSRRVQKLMKVNMKSEHPPELIIKFVNDSIMLDSRINGMSDKEVIDVLIAKEEHEAKSVGVMFHILTCGENQELFSRMIRYINGGGVDYWHTILCNMNMALFELWTFIHWTCKEQLMRLIREGVRQNVKQIENVVMSAFRTTISSSDFVTKTRILNYLSSIIREHDMWFKSQKSCSALVSTILTSVSHAIVSSPAPLTKDDVFRENMTNFVHFVIKTRKPDCATLGRDFLLILIKLGKLPQIEDIWKDLAQNPSSYGVSGIADYMSKPNMLQQLRLSVELMRRIEFMVHHGGKNLQIYFSWLTNKFLRSNDGVGVRAECVRFLMSMQLDPAKLPAIVFENRVQLLHLLIATCQPGPDQQWLKLCLFLDWFGCDERTPMNFNNIDVPLNVIRHSLFLQAPPPHQSSLIQGSHCSHFANSLLEFVCKSVDVILPIIAPQIRKNVNNAMRGCRDRMQHNFSQILDNHKIDRRVTDLLRSVFPDLVRNSSSVLTTAPAKQKKRIVEEKSTVPPPQETDEAVRVLPSTEKNLEKKNEKARIRKEKEQDENENDLNTSMKLLKGELKEKMEVFRNQWKESDENADKCEALENILNTILNSDENLDDTQQELAAQCLLGIMGSVVVDEKSLLPENEKDFSDSFTHPIYYFLRILCYPPDDDDSASEIMTNLMSAMREKDSTLTYVFLYFIKGTGTRLKDCIECYREVARVSDRGVDEMLASDLQMCAINDSRLFAYLLPFVFSHFEEDVMQSPELLQTLCSNLDAVQLRSFVSDVISSMGPDTDCEVIDDVMDNHGDLENKNKMDAKHLKVAMTKTDSYKKLTHAQCLRVIHAVEENPQIWNMRDDGYKDIQAKNTLWAEMEKSMEFLRRDHVWNSLVAAFRVERKNSVKPSGSGAEKCRPEFQYFQDLGYLEATYRDKSPPSEEIKLFRKETFSKMVMASVEWATTPQWVFWHLVHADGVPIEWFLSTIPKLDSTKHDEAIANILLMMKRMDREPWAGLIRAIFHRIPTKNDNFTADALKVLIEDSEQCQKVAELVGQLVKKLLGNSDILGVGVRLPKKGNPLKLTLQHVLEHLQWFSTTCVQKKQRSTEAFMARNHMQDAFAAIKTNEKSSVLLKKYSNLFGAMDIIAQDSKEQGSSRTLRGNRQGSSGTDKQMLPQKRKMNENDDEQHKKRKMHKDVIELSDSDSD